MQKNQGLFNLYYEEAILVLSRLREKGVKIIETVFAVSSLGRIDKEALDIVKTKEDKEK